MSSKLTSVEQKKISELFGAKDALFLIPDYQRPYAWNEDECSTLWDDICSFALPDSEFNSDEEEYFLGPVVLFSNDDKKLEVIDGQQRIITILLILRAFYEAMKNFSDNWSKHDVRKNIGRCIWKTNEQGEPNFSELKIDSQVATDNDRQELIDILTSGTTNPRHKSRYAQNYRLFQENISAFFSNDDISDPQVQNQCSRLPNRILNNCILLPIQAASQDAALRIFSTLNDRGKPLSDSDIFKVQLYKAFSAEGERDTFIAQWKELEELCGQIFSSLKISNPMDELFNRYMYYERAKGLVKDTTLEGLRSFYEKDHYRLLRLEHRRVFENLAALAKFWSSVNNQDEERFSERVLKRLFVLNYAPNSAWTLITSVYFMHNRKPDGTLDDEKFYSFLGKITAFIWGAVILGASVNHLRTPLYKEMVNIVLGKDTAFDAHKFDVDELKRHIMRYKFTGRTKITRSMLAWWVMHDKAQIMLELTTVFETEHISKKGKTVNPATYEMLGNKSLLEGKIKNSVSNLDFPYKKSYYRGIVSVRKAGTKIHELQELAATKNSFNVKDISQRNKRIIEEFIHFVQDNGLAK